MSAPGEVIDGRFKLLERLGSGGMGTVWRARDLALDREVALKEVRPLDPAFTDRNAVLRERALREARALARLSHPHVVAIHQILEPHGHPHPWIAMELLPGSTLESRLARGPLEPTEAARIGRQVLSALRAAHAAGIQHRDVKPANVMFREDGSAVLTDFGIAALNGSTSLTQTGEMIGSPEYIAPERIRGTDSDPASDLWSLGVVLYLTVEGVSPLRRDTALATLAAVLDDPLPPVRSGPLAPVLEALLVRDPAARPDGAQLDAMLAEAEAGRTPRWSEGRTLAARTSPAPSTAADRTPPDPSTLVESPHMDPHAVGRPSRRRRRTPVIAAALVVALAATAALLVTLRGNGDDGNESKDRPTGSPTDSTTPSRTPESPKPSSSPALIPAAGRWVAMLYSEPTSNGDATRDKRLAQLQQTVPDTQYVRSDEYPSLRPGYWVFFTGSFTDGREALSYCVEQDLTDNAKCVGRYISSYISDRGLECHPPVSTPTGTCRRD